MAFAPYWMQVFLPVSAKLKNGIHLIEAEEWRKGWWKVKPFGSSRSKYISPRIWAANPSIPYTGQPFGLAMQELHPKKEKKSAATATTADFLLADHNGPVCQLGPAEAPSSEKDAFRASFTRPSSVRRQGSIRRSRGKKA